MEWDETEAPHGRPHLLIGLIGALVVAAAAVWFVLSAVTDDPPKRITEPSATRAVDGFVRAYNDRDDDQIASRACGPQQSRVTAAARATRPSLQSVHRSTPVEDTSGGDFATRSAHLVGRDDRAGDLVVRSIDGGRWCVLSLTRA